MHISVVLFLKKYIYKINKLEKSALLLIIKMQINLCFKIDIITLDNNKRIKKIIKNIKKGKQD